MTKLEAMKSKRLKGRKRGQKNDHKNLGGIWCRGA